jgi:TIR domain
MREVCVMGLKFKGEWRITPPDDDATFYYRRIPPAALEEFLEVIGKVATQVDQRQQVLEHFKAYFGRAAGMTTGWSSSESWADTDLRRYAGEAARQAPLFIEAFYEACRSFIAEDEERFAPDATMINEILNRHSIGYEIRPPRLVLRGTEPPATSTSRFKISNAQPYDYDVALSFAGEDREYVEMVAKALKAAGVKVFYDLFEKATLWGQNLGDHLSEVYGKRSRFVVVFISKHYHKAWPTHERQIAQARAIRERTIVFLPARFDDTEIPGLPSTVGYIDLRTVTPEELADVILEKLGTP